MRIVEAKHYKDGRLTLERQNSKGKKYRRVIRLNDRAKEIVERRIAEQGDGAIFRTRYGRCWAARSIQCRFVKLSQKSGYRIIAYTIRHSWITHALLRGVDPLTVGILAGHRDATMVMRVYAQMLRRTRVSFWRNCLRRQTFEDVIAAKVVQVSRANANRLADANMT